MHRNTDDLTCWTGLKPRSGHSKQTVIHEHSDLISNNFDKTTKPGRVPPSLLKLLEQIRGRERKKIRNQTPPYPHPLHSHKGIENSEHADHLNTES